MDRIDFDGLVFTLRIFEFERQRPSISQIVTLVTFARCWHLVSDEIDFFFVVVIVEIDILRK